MKKHPSEEELSAYVDGESSSEEQIRQHLQRCEECSRVYVAFCKLSSHIQALPTVQATEGFSVRVTSAASVETPKGSFVRRYAAPLGVAATLIIAFVLMGNRQVDAPQLDDIGATEVQFTFSTLDEDALLAQIEEGLSEEDNVAAFEESLLLGGYDLYDSSSDEILLALAESEWFETSDELWVNVHAFDASWFSLTEDESEAFTDLLSEYAEEGVEL
jgi:hypothetical protein